MPNHVHLLVESSREPLAKFMQGLQQSYSQYFNLHHRKSGHVFQGRYKAIVCDKDEYLLQLIRYIHLNPVRAGMVKEPEKYLYSGHRAYLQGKASETIDPSKGTRKGSDFDNIDYLDSRGDIHYKCGSWHADPDCLPQACSIMSSSVVTNGERRFSMTPTTEPISSGSVATGAATITPSTPTV